MPRRTTDPLPPSSFPTQRPRRDVALPRQVVGSLDALVRSASRDGGNALSLADRVCHHWRRDPLMRLDFSAHGVEVRGRVVLAVADTPWLLPVVMTGVESIAMMPDATGDDVLQLARELSALVVDEERIRDFHDWVFSDGAEGFEVQLSQGFVEASDGLRFQAEAATSSIAVVRGLAAVTEDGLDVLATDLDVAAARPELDVDIDMFEIGARHGAFESSASEIESLRHAVEDPAAWSLAEMEALIESESLRAGLPPEQFARRVANRVQAPLSETYLQILVRIFRQTDEYMAHACDTLVQLEIGRRVGATLRATAEAMTAVDDLLAYVPPGSAARLTEALFERVPDEPALSRTLTTWVRSMPAVDTSTFSPRATSVLVELLVEAGEDARTRSALDTCSDAALVAVFTDKPRLVIQQNLTRLERLLHDGDHEAIGRTIFLLEKRKAWTMDVVRVVAQALVARHGEWPSAAVRVAARAMARRDIAPPEWVTLARTTTVPEAVRVAILEELGRLPRFREEVLRFRWSSILDVGPVRDAISALRAHQRASEAPPEEQEGASV